MQTAPGSILQKVDDALNLLITTSTQHDGLIPSILDRNSGQMPAVTPDPIAGQRQHDRAPRGCNLLHDVDLLALMYERATHESGQRFGEAADGYLQRFARHCTETKSGLFPWGEHAYWDLDRDQLGNSQAFANRTISRGAYHDHLREVPVWMWEKLYKFNGECVERFAEGLKYHWKSGALAHEYFRHAYIEMPEIPLPHEAISRDFPRHGGFSVLDWAFAYCRFRRDEFEQQMRRMNEYWWRHHHPCGMLPQQSRVEGEHGTKGSLNMAQTLSYAASTLSAVELLETEGVLLDLAASMRERATLYATSCVTAPHNIEQDTFFANFDADSLAGQARLIAWGSGYGGPHAVASHAIFMTRLYEDLQDARFLEWAIAAARFILKTPFPTDIMVPARDAGEALALLLDIYDATHEGYWLDEARGLAEQLIAIYFDSPLPRGAAGIDWYEAQLGTGVLLRALGRCAMEL